MGDVERFEDCAVFYDGDDCVGGNIKRAVLDELERLRGDQSIYRLRLLAAHEEIDRLRLTDAEDEIIANAITALERREWGSVPEALRVPLVTQLRHLRARLGGVR